MHKFLILVYENDENGNKKNGVEPQYIELDNELKVREQYNKYRNAYQTTTDEDGNIITTGNKKYTVELSKLQYKTMTKTEADEFVASIVTA